MEVHISHQSGESGHSSAWLVGRYVGSISLQDNLTLCIKVYKTCLYIDLAILFLVIYFKKIVMDAIRFIYKGIHCIFVYNSKKLETT